MSQKKRVYDLAKEYGMTGQDLAAKLRDLGFTQIKGHMTALDDFDVLRIQGVLEAHGLILESKSAQGGMVGAEGLIVRRKKKKKSEQGAADAHAAPREEPAPPAPPLRVLADPRHRGESGIAPSGVAAETVPPAASPLSAPRPGPARTDDVEPELEAIPGEPLEETAPAPDVELEPFAPLPDVAMEEVATVDEPAFVEHAESVDAPEIAESVSVESEDPQAKVIRRRPGGKVVGFVDLSKLQVPVARKTESRRLRSGDDVAPDVQPTLGHDKKRAFVRGDQASRGQLTAAQLREKEAARFLRRKSGAQPVTTRPTRPSRGGSPLDSPFKGGEVAIGAPLTIKKLAEAMALKAGQVLNRAIGLMGLGVNINSTLDEESALLLAHEFQVELRVVHEVEAEAALRVELGRKRTSVEEGDLVLRPPIIAFLGHVDHGKTTLLDTIRNSRVAHGESGGITQHLGAYQVATKKGHRLTIIDTPGHEAFTQMRARGAQAVDIVVLVVAADDGVMASTVEAIAHARSAKSPIVVAVNKCDKPEAQPDRVMQQLAAHDLIPEEWGGSTAMLRISALKGTGVEELLERVFLEGELLELKSHPMGRASGVVLEAEVQEGKGKVAYLLVQDGTLNPGDIILAGEGYGRVRSIHNDRNRPMEKAGPSTPVQVSGLSELPSVGDQFYVVEKLEQARLVAEERANKNRSRSLGERRQVTTDNLLQAVADQSKKTINVVLKADVQGSLEALRPQVENLTHAEVEVRLLYSALGTITESDVNLAITSQAMIVGFHVGVNDKARQAADRSGVEIRPYDVIYELLDELRLMMEGTLAPAMTEEITGHVEVRRLFKSSRWGNIAGSHVLDGVINRDSQVRVLRGGKLVHAGSVASLRREKDDVREVREGFDCGVVVRGFDALQEGDVIEAFKVVAVKRLLKI